MKKRAERLDRVEAAIVRLYTVTLGRGRTWRAVQRAVTRFVASADKVLKLAFGVGVAARLVLGDARDDFFATLVARLLS